VFTLFSSLSDEDERWKRRERIKEVCEGSGVGQGRAMAFFIWGAHLGPTLGEREGLIANGLWGSPVQDESTQCKRRKGRSRNHKIPRQRNGSSRPADQRERKKEEEKEKWKMDE
jgi:hypothetical protein